MPSSNPFRSDARGELFGQHLHHDLALQPGVRRDERARHSAPAQLALELVSRPEGLLKLIV